MITCGNAKAFLHGSAGAGNVVSKRVQGEKCEEEAEEEEEEKKVEEEEEGEEGEEEAAEEVEEEQQGPVI